MQKKHLIIFLLPAVMLLSLILTGCSIMSVVKTVEIKDDTTFETTSGSFDYSAVTLIVTYSDGKREEIPLTEDMIPASEALKLYKPGEQTVKIDYGGAMCELKVDVRRRPIPEDVKFNGGEDGTVTFDYDGLPHSVTISGRLPEGAKVIYPGGNSFTSAGEYEVSAVIICDGYETGTRNIKFVINKAKTDISGILFEDTEASYTGENISVFAENIPEGLTAVYETYASDGVTKTDGIKEAGEYIQKLILIPNNPNYETIEKPLTRKITVKKAEYETGETVFSDKTVGYDTRPHTITLSGTSGVPAGVKIRYGIYAANGVSDDEKYTVGLSTLEEVKSATSAGKYLFVAFFEGDGKNYEQIPEKRAFLTIEKAVIDTTGLDVFSAFLDYDGEMYGVDVSGKIPDKISVRFLYNGEEAEGQRRAGTYAVRAEYVVSDPENYIAVPGYDEATLIIYPVTEQSGFSASNIGFDPDAKQGEPKYKLVGVKEGMNVDLKFTKDGTEISPDKLVQGESYTFSAKFSFDDEDKNASVTVPDVSGEMYLRLGIEVPEFDFDDLTVTYDGKPHYITVSEEIPEGVLIVTGNGMTEAGTYQVIAEFNENAYNVVYAGGAGIRLFTATLTIEKKKIDLSALTFSDETLTYDTKTHTFTVAGEIPEDITVTYENNTVKDAGVYEAKAIFSAPDETNYEINVDKLEATITVDKKLLDTSVLTLSDLSDVYNGEAKTLTVTGTVPEGITVAYTDNVKTEPGVYDVKVTFTAPDEKNYIVPVKELSSTLTITKIPVTVPAFTFSNVHVTYDGESHSLSEISGLPDYITVTYSDVLTYTSAGYHYVKATLSHVDPDHYELDVTEKTACMMIDRQKIDLLDDLGMENSIEVSYTGEKHYYPEDALSIFAEYRFSSNGVTDVGRHKITLTISDQNYTITKYGEEQYSFDFYIYVIPSSLSLVCEGGYWKFPGFDYSLKSYEATVTFGDGTTVTLSSSGTTRFYKPDATVTSVSGRIEPVSFDYHYFEF